VVFQRLREGFASRSARADIRSAVENPSLNRP
jgi:hypothetical protein